MVSLVTNAWLPNVGGSTVSPVTVGTRAATARVNDRLAGLPSAAVTFRV